MRRRRTRSPSSHSVVFSTSLFGQTKEAIRDAQCTIEVRLPEKTSARIFRSASTWSSAGMASVPSQWNDDNNVSAGG